MKKKKVIYNILLILFLAIFLVSGTIVVLKLIEYHRGEEIQSEAENMVMENLSEKVDEISKSEPSDTTPDSPETTDSATVEEETPATVLMAELLNELDLEKLQDVNSDVRGWIVIPESVISYPILQGGDNSTYLNRSYSLEKISSGSIFMDYRCSSDLSDFNTVIYGHNMKNGSMFASLNKYSEQQYYDIHQNVYITLNSGTYRCSIFSAYVGNYEGPAYTFTFSGDEAKQSFLDKICSKSVIESDIVPTVSDNIITLSTCTGSVKTNRMIVHAVISEFTPR